MSIKRLVIICTLPSFLAGCAEFYGSQPPAPVYGGQPKTQKPSVGTQNKAKTPDSSSKEIVKIQPLKDFSAIRSEPLTPELPLPEPTTPVPTEPATLEALEPSAPPPPQPSELTPFEPIGPTVPLSPVVGALVSAANQNSKGGDLDSAAASIERAIRIEPRNANLFYKLALLRLQQSKPRLAEDLAKKSALLASTDNTLKKHCWLLIAHSREMQQDFAGAKEARAKADSF
ncbi:MAG: tetratricopeptide repeat protein [Methylobacter sp.]